VTIPRRERQSDIGKIGRQERPRGRRRALVALSVLVQIAAVGADGYPKLIKAPHVQTQAAQQLPHVSVSTPLVGKFPVTIGL